MKAIISFVLGVTAIVFLQTEYQIFQKAQTSMTQLTSSKQSTDQQETNQQDTERSPVRAAYQPHNRLKVGPNEPCNTQKVKGVLTELEQVKVFGSHWPTGRGSLCKEYGASSHKFFPDGATSIARIKQIHQRVQHIEAVTVSLNTSHDSNKAPWVTVAINRE
jgi:hypothetical protein